MKTSPLPTPPPHTIFLKWERILALMYVSARELDKLRSKVQYRVQQFKDNDPMIWQAMLPDSVSPVEIEDSDNDKHDEKRDDLIWCLLA